MRFEPLPSQPPLCCHHIPSRERQRVRRRSEGATGSSLLAAPVAVFVLCLFSCFIPTIAVEGGVCTYYSPMGAHFDLSDLVRHGDMPSYAVTDGDIPCTPEIEKNYTYIFNICNQVSGEIPKACDSFQRPAALQLDRRANMLDSEGICRNAGRFEATTAEQSKQYFQLLDPNDPSKGISLTYTGDNCQHNEKGEEVATPRKFRLDFECANVPVAVPVHALEHRHCDYTVTIPSIFGCPTECPAANRQLCGGKGHCAYDHDQRSPRCFCDEGWRGKDCTMPEEKAAEAAHHDSAITGVVITLFVVVLLLGVVTLVMFKQIRAYKEDATNYIMLAANETDGV